MKRNRKFATLVGLTTAVAIAVPTAVAATPSCAWGITPERPVAVAVRAALAADGEVADVSRAVSGTDHCWAATRAPEADDLPIDVAVLYRDADGRSLEASELGGAVGPVTVRIAVRDRTATDQLIAVTGPLSVEHVVERVGVPQVVTIGIDLPSGWEDLEPATEGASVDVQYGGLRVRHAGLLFPPVTDDELVLELSVRPGEGVPTITVDAAPAGQDADDAITGSFDRETAAVIAAINELSAEGAEQLADGADQLADGAAQLAAGIDQLMVGLGPLADGASQVADGIDQLGDGLDEAADGAHQIAEGNAQIADGVAPLAEGTQALYDGVVEIRAAIADSIAAGDIDESATTALAESMVAFFSRALPAEVQEYLPTIEELTTDPAALVQLIPDELIAWLLVPLDEAVAGIGELNDGVQELYGGLRALADGSQQLAEGLDEAVAGARELADGAHQVADGIHQVADGVGQLGDGAHQIADGNRQLAAGAAQLPEGMREAAAIADRSGLSDARMAAVLRVGARKADTVVRITRGDSESGAVAFELTTAGDTPMPIWSWTLIGSVLVSLAAVATIWWRRRRVAKAAA